jgi:hypothetical protein
MGRTCGIYGEKEHAFQLWWENLKARDRLEDLDGETRIISKQDGKAWTE